MTTERVPGTPSSVEATGWGGRTAPVLHVEGAVPDAPLRIADKPRPQGDKLVMVRPTAPRTLNCFATSDSAAWRIASNYLGRLLGVDPDAPQTPVPALAFAWSVSDDKLTCTYRLRRGVQFADGRPLTSADVRFTYDVVCDPTVNARDMRGSVAEVVSLETPTPDTVVVRFARPCWWAIYALGHEIPILNRAWYEEQIPVRAERLGIAEFATEPGRPGFAEVFNRMDLPCPGIGPYYLASRDDFTRERLTFRRNPFHYGIQVHPERHNLAELGFRFPASSDEAAYLLRSQEIDMAVVGHDEWEDFYEGDEWISAHMTHHVYDHAGLHAWAISWNCRRPPFDDARVRRAMTHLLDREMLLGKYERGHGQVAVCPSKPAYASYSHDLPAKEFSIAKARALLAEAGWTESDGVLRKDDRQFAWELKLPPGGEESRALCRQIRQACLAVGIALTVRVVEWDRFLQEVHENRDFDAAVFHHSWAGPWLDLFESYHSSEDRPDGGNTVGWRCPRADELLEQMRAEFDADRRNALFHEFNRVFYDEQPETLLLHPLVGVLVNRRFEGVRVAPTGIPVAELWVRPENVRHDPERARGSITERLRGVLGGS